MNRIYKNYINSRGINRTSAIGRYTQTADNDNINCYELQKQEIKKQYHNEQEEQKQIDEMGKSITKKLDDIFKGYSLRNN